MILIIMGDWSYFRIIQKISVHHLGKAQNQGSTENSHIGHCTYILESTYVII
jgi:hypothetical protein